ncbi:anti-sigma regulatory factor [Mycobacterium sp. E2462]|nr:anti-sigma regulatory factor [Mycobacterium sp. E1214]OBH23912.1 anti-sigma regulatory factor [Mycobacterium sp. E1319]OBI23238.1 anti-sigma regulatory factor [Mycobacterium sp. E2462]
MSPLTSETALRLTLAGPASPDTAAEWRRALQRWLRHEVRMSAEVLDDVVLGVNEALANCVEHAYHAGIGVMKLQASYDPRAESIRVCVSDRGNWQRPSPKKANDPRASRGIMLMHGLADHCTIHARPNGTSVYLDYATEPDAVAERSL